MEDLEKLLFEKIEARSKLNMEIFSIQETLRLLNKHQNNCRNGKN